MSIWLSGMLGAITSATLRILSDQTLSSARPVSCWRTAYSAIADSSVQHRTWTIHTFWRSRRLRQIPVPHRQGCVPVGKEYLALHSQTAVLSLALGTYHRGRSHANGWLLSPWLLDKTDWR